MIKKIWKNSTTQQWFLPIGILCILMVGLLSQFSVTGRMAESRRTESEILVETQNCAEILGNFYNSALKSSDTIANYIAKQSKTDLDVKALLEAICESTDAYDAVYIGTDGMGFNKNGEAVDLSNEMYYQSARLYNKDMFYTAKGTNGQASIATFSAVKKDEVTEGLILCYYDSTAFGNLLSGKFTNTDAFFLLMEANGNTIFKTGTGAETSGLCASSANYIEYLRSVGDNKQSADNFYVDTRSKSKDMEYFKANGEERGLFYVPTGASNFYLVVGINKSYIESCAHANWAANSTIVWEILAAMIALVAIVLGLNISIRMKEKERSRELANKADTDQLTNLSNKMATERKIKEYMAEHPNQLCMLLVLDVDNFKKVNDTMGHAFGDEVLCMVAARVRSEFRITDIVGRTGGDEFTIFLCNMKEKANIKTEAKRMERLFWDFQVGDYVKYSVTASIGAAIFPSDATSFEELYKNADAALYKAKNRGKNQLAFYADEWEN